MCSLANRPKIGVKVPRPEQMFGLCKIYNHLSNLTGVTQKNRETPAGRGREAILESTPINFFSRRDHSLSRGVAYTRGVVAC